MRRRDFIKVVAVSAAALPLAARAQKSSSVRRVGVLMSTASDDSLGQAYSAAFAQGLQQLGWEIGSNIRIDYRWGSGDTERFRKYAAELVGLSPDVVLGTAASIVRALQEASRTIPIVFVTTIDPVGSGLVASLSHPGRQRHRFHLVRIQSEREAAGTAQGDRARSQPCSGASRSHCACRLWRLCRHPDRGAIFRRGTDRH